MTNYKPIDQSPYTSRDYERCINCGRLFLKRHEGKRSTMVLGGIKIDVWTCSSCEEVKE